MPRAFGDARIIHPGERSAKVAKTIVSTVAPGAANKHAIATRWIHTTGSAVYALTNYSAGVPNWELQGSPTDILGTANQIDVAVASNGKTLSLNEAIPQTATVSLTATEIKALATTPIELVAAPGAVKALKFMGASFKLVAGSEVLAESGDNLGIKYTNAAGVQVSQTVECTGFIDQSADTYTNAEVAINGIVAASAAENAALVLDNLGSNFTGNVSDDSTLEISTLYRVVEL